MTPHPYSDLPDSSFWRRAVAAVPPHELDPVTSVAFEITRDDRVAAAGSCFAQHIARYLSTGGFHYLVTEPPHPLLELSDAAAWNYGVYSARFGNLYTVRQLCQLFDRAYARFEPVEPNWRNDAGAWIDPFRPQIQPGGFASEPELIADRERHLRAVRQMFETLDVFVFTLGLTEAWRSREDGTVFPVSPGVVGGEFDPDRYEFHNFGTAETTADLNAFIDDLRSVNPKARVLLTVSPVPLVATATPHHVLTATTYSKSVLRVACEEAGAGFDGVEYFPSYEIITSGATRGRYFADDLRSVREEGVAHVMRVFFRHFCGIEHSPTEPTHDEQPVTGPDLDELVQVQCEEEALDRVDDASPAEPRQADPKPSILRRLTRR